MNLKDLQIRLKSLINGVVDKALMGEVGQEVVGMVKDRTRKGFGVPQNLGAKKPLPGISESYKKQRRRLRGQGKLSSETTPNKSNLTNTGKLVDSIDYTATSNEVKVEPQGRSNQKKAAFQADAGRIAFNLSKSENKKILKLIEDSITKDIKKKGL